MITFLIGSNKPGSPVFKAYFSVYVPAETLTGIGNIVQSSNQPHNIPTNLEGQFTYRSVTPNSYQIFITATGKPIVKWPNEGGIDTLASTNVDLEMVISDDWKTGTANYKYMNCAGKWSEITNAPVKAIMNDFN